MKNFSRAFNIDLDTIGSIDAALDMLCTCINNYAEYNALKLISITFYDREHAVAIFEKPLINQGLERTHS